MTTAQLLRRTAALALAALCAGCGGGPTAYPVKGRVAFKDGRPFTDGTVEFEPAGGGPPARGRIQPDGTFALTTYRDNDGAVAGAHRAVVVWTPPAGAGNDEKVLRPPLHPRFRDYERSGLRFVVARGPNEVAITVEKP